jgi:hypothetical protein
MLRPWCKPAVPYLCFLFIAFVSWRAGAGDFGSAVIFGILLCASHSYCWSVGRSVEQEKHGQALVEKRYEDYLAREESARHVKN